MDLQIKAFFKVNFFKLIFSKTFISLRSLSPDPNVGKGKNKLKTKDMAQEGSLQKQEWSDTAHIYILLRRKAPAD